LSLREGRVPGSFQGVAIFPVEVMIPDKLASRVGLEMGDEPVSDQEKLAAAVKIAGALPEIVVAESVLGDGDGVVLKSDAAVIVELGNARSIVGASVVRFLGEGHVVFAELSWRGVRILYGRFVPESEMAFASKQIGAEDASVVVEAGQAFILRQGCASEALGNA